VWTCVQTSVDKNLNQMNHIIRMADSTRNEDCHIFINYCRFNIVQLLGLILEEPVYRMERG
jgi:hypothetical protein